MECSFIAMPDAAFAKLLYLLSPIGSVLALYRLYSTRLYRKYRIFSAFLVFWLVASVPPLFLDQSGKPYFSYFVAAAVIGWYFYIRIVFEMLALVLERHKGFYTLGRWAIYGGLAVSLVISALALYPKLTPQMEEATVATGVVMAVERGLSTALAVFLVLTVGLLNFYTVPLSRNVVVHVVVYTTFFLSNSLGMILWKVLGFNSVAALNTGFAAVSAACGFAWFFLLSAKGEETRLHAPWFQPAMEERILFQLDSFNAAVLKAARK